MIYLVKYVRVSLLISFLRMYLYYLLAILINTHLLNNKKLSKKVIMKKVAFLFFCPLLKD